MRQAAAVAAAAAATASETIVLLPSTLHALTFKKCTRLIEYGTESLYGVAEWQRVPYNHLAMFLPRLRHLRLRRRRRQHHRPILEWSRLYSLWPLVLAHSTCHVELNKLCLYSRIIFILKHFCTAKRACTAFAGAHTHTPTASAFDRIAFICFPLCSLFERAASCHFTRGAHRVCVCSVAQYVHFMCKKKKTKNKGRASQTKFVKEIGHKSAKRAKV